MPHSYCENALVQLVADVGPHQIEKDDQVDQALHQGGGGVLG